jgi:hypothetical protein
VSESNIMPTSCSHWQRHLPVSWNNINHHPDYPFDSVDAARVTFSDWRLVNDQLDTLTAFNPDEIGDPVRGTSSEWGVSLLSR